VPEPELALFISPGGKIQGYTIGNDMSSRDIEGENPLYLPQAKSYDGSCALGPAILVTPEALAPSTEIRMSILRAGASVFADSTTLAAMKRSPAEATPSRSPSTASARCAIPSPDAETEFPGTRDACPSLQETNCLA
jgi:fumarylacetoacetate (FAA) hydrolase family protein